MRFSISHPTRLDFGIACGVAIALVDGFANGGEVSPVVVVAIGGVEGPCSAQGSRVGEAGAHGGRRRAHRKR